MEAEWNKLTPDERAEFAVFYKGKMAALEAKARAAADAEANPPLKRYADMTAAEQAAFRRKAGVGR